MGAVRSPSQLAGSGSSVRWREWATLTLVSVVALAGTYESTRRGAAVLLVLALLPPLIWLLTKSYGGLIAGLALLLVVPYWYTLGFHQMSVVRAAALCGVACLIVNRRFRPHLIDAAVLAFVAVVVLNWLLLDNHPHVGRIVTTELTPIGLYFGARAIPKARIAAVMVFSVLAGTIGALTVLYEAAIGQVVFVDPTKYGTWAGGAGLLFRPAGIFGSPPGAATSMCVIILFGLSCLTIVSGRLKTIVLACLGVCLLALVVTFTRTGLVACAVGVLVFLTLWRPRVLWHPRALWTLSVAGIAVFVVLPTLHGSSTYQQGVLRGGTLATREGFWQQALPITTASPKNLILGVGTGVLEAPLVTNQFQIPSAVAISPVITSISLQNEYVTTMFEQGLVGLATLLFFLFAGSTAAVRTARRYRDGVHAGLAGAIAAIMVVMITGTVLLEPVEFALLLIALGFVANLRGEQCPGLAQRVERRPERHEVATSSTSPNGGTLGSAKRAPTQHGG
jgi:O-antigen ligase